MSRNDEPIHPKTVLVIGGGPAGLVTLRNLLQRGQFDRVELVERRDDVGGVWYLDPPSTSPSKKPRFPSPAYPGLIGNVLPEFLSFSEFPFPAPPNHPEQPFPNLTQTHEYLKAFAEPLKDKIRLNSEVTRVEERPGGGWKVSLNDWSSEADEPRKIEEEWDAVVVAVCWYDNPVWPETEGIDLLREEGIAIHSTFWRGPKPEHKDKHVLVLGNANSSNDIAAQLAPFAKSPVYRSIRRKAFPGFVSLPDERILDVKPVQKYILEERNANEPLKATAILQDGTEIKHIDEVQVGTGYRPYPSFIHVLSVSDSGLVPLMSETISPHRIPHLYRLILYSYNPSLAFIGTAAVSYTPFTIADVSSTWLALAWSNQISYPNTPVERLVSETERLDAVAAFRASEEVKDNPSSLFIYGVLGDSEPAYAAGLKEDIVKVRPQLKDVLSDWNDEKTEKRNAMFTTKREVLEFYREKLKREQASEGLAN